MKFDRRTILKMLGMAPMARVSAPEAGKAYYEVPIPNVLEPPPAPATGYQWMRNGVPIDGAVGRTYTLQSDDVGCNVQIRMTAVNTAGSSEHVVGDGFVPKPYRPVYRKGVRYSMYDWV